MVKVLVADKNFLSRIGLELLVGELKGFELVPSVCGDKEDLENQLQLSKPRLLIVDFLSLGISISELDKLRKRFSKTRFMVITEMLTKPDFSAVLATGVNAYLLKECDRLEILEAVNASIQNQNFICSKIAAVLAASPEISINNAFIKSLACDGIPVTEREIDVIRGIAEGLSNKLIADKLSLSTHTVNTHRKNGLLETNFNLHS